MGITVHGAIRRAGAVWVGQLIVFVVMLLSIGLAGALGWIFNLERRETLILLTVIVVLDSIAAVTYLVMTYRRPRRRAG